jgi:hypothetical protein
MDTQLGCTLSDGNEGYGASTCQPQYDHYLAIKPDTAMEMRILQLPQFYTLFFVVSLPGQHIDTLFGLKNQGILQVAFQYPFRTLDRPTADCSCNWRNIALLQHVVFKAFMPCDYFLHVSRTKCI